jgi:translation initiation factor IF-3
VNDRIKASPVRLIGPDGQQFGIMPISEALNRSRDMELDLVEVSPNSRPPVCRILDYGKFKYEQSKKEKQAKKRQHSYQLKEMRYRPKTDDHDYNFKNKHVRQFLESGSKVRVFVMFRGRELAYTDRGRVLLDRVAEDMNDIATVDQPPKREGRHMSMILSPRSEVLKRLKAAEGSRKDDKGGAARKKAEKVEATTEAASDPPPSEAEKGASSEGASEEA